MTSWILNHGDCLDPVSGLASLADRSVGVTITDPPYEAEAHTLQRRYKTGAEIAEGERTIEPAALDFGAITAEQRSGVAAQIARVTSQRAIVFCQVEAITAWRASFAACATKRDALEYRRTLVWIRATFLVSFNNSATAGLGEWLAEHEDLRTYVERRGKVAP